MTLPELYRGGLYDSAKYFPPKLTNLYPFLSPTLVDSSLVQVCVLPKVNECMKQIRGGSDGLTLELWEKHSYWLLIARVYLIAKFCGLYVERCHCPVFLLRVQDKP